MVQRRGTSPTILEVVVGCCEGRGRWAWGGCCEGSITTDGWLCCWGGQIIIVRFSRRQIYPIFSCSKYTYPSQHSAVILPIVRGVVRTNQSIPSFPQAIRRD